MRDSITIALAASDGEVEQTSWIQLFPKGPTVVARDGRVWFLDDPKAVVASSQARAGSTPLPIDYEHQTERAAVNGQPSPAAGWITGLEARADGIWGKVEWTARAASLISAREYRFISPTFFHTETKEILAISHAALTNTPALEMKALATDQGNSEMNAETLAQIKEALGLGADAADDAVLEAVKSLSEKSATAQAAAAGEYVPIEVLERVTAQLNQLNRGVSAEAAVIAVDREVASGRLIPALRDWGVALCTANKPAFDGFVERTSGSLKHLFAPAASPAVFAAAAVSEVDEQVARALGHDPKTVASAGKA